VAKKRRVLWTKIRDARRREWSVYLVPFIRENRTHRGITDTDKLEIRIAYTNDYTLMTQTLVHEILHASSPRSMADGETDPHKLAAFHEEEAFISDVEENLHALLVSLRGDVFPEIPDEAALLAA
jgi:hypothetical protein